MELKLLLLFFVLLAAWTRSEFVSIDPASWDARLERARQILSEVPLIDGHNDLAMNIHDILNNQLALFPFEKNLTDIEPYTIDVYSHTDLPRLEKGMIGAQFWSAFVPCSEETVDDLVQGIEQVDVIKRLIERYPNDLQFADSAEGIIDAFGNGKIASLIGLEGGHMINASLAVLRTYYTSGVRYLTLTHACNVPWAQTSYAEGNDTSEVVGLTDFGKLVIGEMNRLGMIIDISHVSAETMEDVMDTTAAPVIFSHSNARELCNHTRNVPNDILRKLKGNGGLVMVNFYPPFVTCSERATLHDVIDHINFIRNMSGVDHVGIGADFNGINLVPEGLEDVSKYPNLFAELLLDETWTDDDLKKLAGLNFLRVFELIESVKTVLSTEEAIETAIQE